jgi:hypothetical protein
MRENQMETEKASDYYEYNLGVENLDMAQNIVINGDISKEKRGGVFMEGEELKGNVEEQINEGELRGSSG